MEKGAALAERIRVLKAIAASMHEGSIRTLLVPEVDKVLALPDDVSTTTVGELEAVARQVRELEQAFDRLGYTLLDQIMPTTGVSAVFQVVQAADEFKTRFKKLIGRTFQVDDTAVDLDAHAYETLTRYSLSIGTPPVTGGVRDLVDRILFGRPTAELRGFIETLECDRLAVQQLIDHLTALTLGSLHCCTQAEEQQFLRDATQFVNFEGATLFNRVAITESPERVIQLIVNHVFDKFGPQDTAAAVRLVEGVDRIDGSLLSAMRKAPNHVFVARVTRVPHGLFTETSADGGWRSVIGRLILIDVSRRARLSNTTIVYTLFPHVARTLRNVQTGFAGRPANTQLELRRVLERFSAGVIGQIRVALEGRLATLRAERALDAGVDEVRVHEWRREGLFECLTLGKLHRLVSFLEELSLSDETSRRKMGQDLSSAVAADWMRYFYASLPTDRYGAAVVPGGGRGALTLVGELHCKLVRAEVEAFTKDALGPCRARLDDIKRELHIPQSSSDEIEAAIKQSQLRALAPSQWSPAEGSATKTEYVARTMMYRVAELAGRATRATEGRIDRAAFGNLLGPAAAAVKKVMSRAGLSALHGYLEDRIGESAGKMDRGLRELLVPFQALVRSTQEAMNDLKGEIDPVAVGEIEAVLQVIGRGGFAPTLILAEMSWTYGDVFPEKTFPRACTLRIPLNDRHEMDPQALLQRLEELRYLFRRFPEIFELFCKSMLLVVNSPHNPTGVVYRRETVLKLLQIAAEYDIAVVDDDAYHKLVTSDVRAREGDDSVAQTYEKYRSMLGRPVRIITVGATTKGLQGSGDRTGLVFSNVPEVLDHVRECASDPHLLSLYMTRLKLETGLAAKRFSGVLERLAAKILDPATTPDQAGHELRALLEAELAAAADPSFPVAVFATMLDGYEELLRLGQRGGSVRHLSEHLSVLVDNLEGLRLELRLRGDIEERVLRVHAARAKALPNASFIDPEGAFYACVRLCAENDDRGVSEFLRAISRHRKVDVTWAGQGFARLSLGGGLPGDARGYDRFGLAVETYLGLLGRYWERFEKTGRDVARLDEIFTTADDAAESLAREDGAAADPIVLALRDLLPLLRAHPPVKKAKGLPVSPGERGVVYCIEEGKSVADKIFVESGACTSVEQMLQSRAFRVIYRRLLARIHRQHTELRELPFEDVDGQYGPLACLAAYRDRQLIDAVFRDLVVRLYRAWHGPGTVKMLAVRLDAGRHPEKIAALHGMHRGINDLVNELMHAFEMAGADATTSFEVGYEILEGIRPSPLLPRYLGRLVERCTFTGATAPLNPAPSFVTGAAKRVSDYSYGFARRDAPGDTNPPLEYFRRRLESFAAFADPTDYVCKVEQVGPFRMLVVIHKACFHLINDELRLFPQLEAVQLRENLDDAAWDGVMLFGLPARVMGDSYKTGYVLDRRTDGALLPTAWVAREDATDYVGFFKKTLLTMHNERVKALGGLPVHGAMFTITFKNGLRKTLVFSADSGTGKSETITAMMEQQIEAAGPIADVKRVDILAGDMLSLWRGEDGQIYAFGTETGDFLRLTDITETWKARYGDLLKRGSTSNLDHPKNPRVTIPGICDANRLLAPTRVNGFFYIDNYSPAGPSAVELSDDPHHVLKHVLVRGLRKNKGTAGDQPTLRAGLEHAGETRLVTRHRHAIDELLDWQERLRVDGKRRTCLAFRDGSGDVFAAREVVQQAFVGRRFLEGGRERTIRGVDHDVLQNVFRLRCADGTRVPLDREVYDQIYEPLVSTFCGNPFVDPEGMNECLEVFAETMHGARVQTGIIKTQLARDGYEFSGPAKAAHDVVTYLLEDEEVNARFQRNKSKVHRAMQRTFGGILEIGSNLPVELEGYNLLLLEAHESTHVAFQDLAGKPFTLSTPLYRYQPPAGGPPKPFVPAIATPERLQAIADICSNADHAIDLSGLAIDLGAYDRIHFWTSIEELVYQVLLVNGVVSLGSSEAELARFPHEVRKALHVAERILRTRAPEVRDRPSLAAASPLS